MELDEAMARRHAFRALESIKMTDEMVRELLEAASLAPSCNNRQPWRFVIIRDPARLDGIFETLAMGNYWMKKSSMVIAVISGRELDCVIGEVEYNMFDTGLATAFLLLKATEMGLVAHPIAGFNNAEARKVLNVPEDHTLITLIAVGKRSGDLSILGEKHREMENHPRERKDTAEIGFMETFP